MGKVTQMEYVIHKELCNTGYPVSWTGGLVDFINSKTMRAAEAGNKSDVIISSYFLRKAYPEETSLSFSFR